MMQIILEIVKRSHLWQNCTRNLFMIGKYLL